MAGYNFVTLSEIKDQLEIQDNSRNTHLLRLGEIASSLIFKYVTDENKVLWNDINVPPTVKAATLVTVAKLFANRGDGVDDTPIPVLPQFAKDLLFDYHTPTCA